MDLGLFEQLTEITWKTKTNRHLQVKKDRRFKLQIQITHQRKPNDVCDISLLANSILCLQLGS